MKKSDALRQKRAAAIEAQKALHTKAEAEKRSLNEAETVEFRAKQTEIETLTAEITDAENYEANLRSLGTGAPSVMGTGNGEEKEKRQLYGAFDFSKALRSAPSGNFDGIEKEVNDIATAEMRASGKMANESSFNIPSDMVRASAQTVTEDSGNYGGQLVPGGTPRPVAGFLPRLFLEEMGATVLTGLSGSVPLPVVEEYDFGWYAETATISSQKKAITGPTLSQKRAGAVVLISNMLLNQSSVDVRGLVLRMLGAGAAKCLNSAAISGTGLSNDPTGLLNMTGILTSTQADDAAATWTRIVELQGLLNTNDATNESRGYLLSPALEASLMTIKKDAGSGLFLSEGGKIAGLKSVATSLVPAIAAAGGNPELHHLICGDFNQMFIGQFGGISFVVDPVSAADANSLKVVVNMGADVQVANKKAFAINSWLSL